MFYFLAFGLCRGVGFTRATANIAVPANEEPRQHTRLLPRNAKAPSLNTRSLRVREPAAFRASHNNWSALDYEKQQMPETTKTLRSQRVQGSGRTTRVAGSVCCLMPTSQTPHPPRAEGAAADHTRRCRVLPGESSSGSPALRP